MARAVKMVNRFGKVRYQPETSKGLHEYDTGWYYQERDGGKKLPLPLMSEPVLYRKEKTAIWYAEAEEDLAHFQAMSQFKEAR